MENVVADNLRVHCVTWVAGRLTPLAVRLTYHDGQPFAELPEGEPQRLDPRLLARRGGEAGAYYYPKPITPLPQEVLTSYPGRSAGER